MGVDLRASIGVAAPIFYWETPGGDIMKRVLGFLVIAATAAVAAPASAQIVVNGTKDAAYGTALAVQTVETQFGDNFSELDAAYGQVSGGRLNLLLTGNIEANFNKLEIFIDSKTGGQATFTSAGNDGSANMNGLKFDTPFTADYHIIARRGADAGNDKFDLDFARLTTPAFTSYSDVLGGLTGTGSTGTGVNASAIQVGYDNSNTAGVLGGTAAADQTAAAAVTTGLELSIALSDLGYAGGPIRIMAGQNNQGHDFWSNQFLGGVPAGTANLGSPGSKDFTTFAGNQFFTVAPEPATGVLSAFVVLGLGALSRRRPA